MFQTFISRHNSNFFSDKLVLTSVTPASSAPVLQTPKATSSTLYFDSLTVNAGNGGFLHCIQMDTSVNAANQVVSVGADIAFDADPKFFACLVRFESSSVLTTLPRSEERFSRNAETDVVCRLLLEKKKPVLLRPVVPVPPVHAQRLQPGLAPLLVETARRQQPAHRLDAVLDRAVRADRRSAPQCCD